MSHPSSSSSYAATAAAASDPPLPLTQKPKPPSVVKGGQYRSGRSTVLGVCPKTNNHLIWDDFIGCKQLWLPKNTKHTSQYLSSPVAREMKRVTEIVLCTRNAEVIYGAMAKDPSLLSGIHSIRVPSRARTQGRMEYDSECFMEDGDCEGDSDLFRHGGALAALLPREVTAIASLQFTVLKNRTNQLVRLELPDLNDDTKHWADLSNFIRTTQTLRSLTVWLPYLDDLTIHEQESEALPPIGMEIEYQSVMEALQANKSIIECHVMFQLLAPSLFDTLEHHESIQSYTLESRNPQRGCEILYSLKIFHYLNTQKKKPTIRPPKHRSLVCYGAGDWLVDDPSRIGCCDFLSVWLEVPKDCGGLDSLTLGPGYEGDPTHFRFPRSQSLSRLVFGESMLELSMIINNIPNLRELQLDIDTDDQDRCVQPLASWLGSPSCRLEFIRINMMWGDDENTEAAIPEILYGLKNNRSLSEFQLSESGTEFMNSSAICKRDAREAIERNKNLVCGSFGEYNNSEIRDLFHKNWTRWVNEIRLAPLLAFVRANRGHPYQYSILPLLKPICEMFEFDFKHATKTLARDAPLVDWSLFLDSSFSRSQMMNPKKRK